MMVLQERMCITKMDKGEGVVPYLMRLTQIRGELGAVGSKTVDEELVWIALNGFSEPWDTFVKGVVAREKLLDWQRLWDDFVQEETRMGQGLGSSNIAPQIVDEEALSLTGKSKGKAKRKKDGKKNLDVSKASVLSATSRDTLPPSAQTGRRRVTLSWLDLQRWKSLAKTSMRIFAC